MPTARDANGNQMQAIRPIRSYDLSASVASAAFAAGVTMVRVAATADTRITLGTAPVASATGTLLPAGAIDYFPVVRGEKIIATAACNVTECA